MNLQDTQAAIAAAVTPVVMISANAVLIGGINNRHQSMTERMRTLAAEWRNATTPRHRRESIVHQIRLIDERLRWVSLSHIILYIATACFIAMVIVIAVSPALEYLSGASLTLLISGVALMFLGILLELLDLARARATIRLEVAEVENDKVA
jgi:VIT1/CCC1 family predicted Fe2+/Mn2+ transporter